MYRGMFFYPWHDLRNLRKEVHRVVKDFLRNEPEWESGYWQPAVDLVETDDAYVVIAEIPGVKRDEIKISMNENNLRISGERKPLHDLKQHLRSECYYGPFRRSIHIPDEVNKEKITAKYENGLLEVTLPRQKKSAAQEIKIEVN